MASGAQGAKARGWLLAGVLACVTTGVPVRGQEGAREAAFARVRAADNHAAALLRTGRGASPTVREMLRLLEDSDLIIYIETRPLRLPGQLQLVAAAPGCRHLRLSVRTPGLDIDQTAWLAHELWHAVEIAGATEARDQASLLRLYQRIGGGDRYGDSAESGKAQQIGTKVLYELRRAR
jgi:hypothetical protein